MKPGFCPSLTAHYLLKTGQILSQAITVCYYFAFLNLGNYKLL